MNTSTYAGIPVHSILMQECVTLRNRMTARSGWLGGSPGESSLKISKDILFLLLNVRVDLSLICLLCRNKTQIMDMYYRSRRIADLLSVKI